MNKGRLLRFFISRSAYLPALLVLGAVLTSTFYPLTPAHSQAVFGGPEDTIFTSAESSSAFLEASAAPDGLTLAPSENQTAGFVILEESVAYGAASPFDGALPSRDEIITYTVQEGDTLSTIAEKFGISLSTLLWANSGISANRINVGTKITILPISGVLHKVVSGDTISSLSIEYGVLPSVITRFNKLENDQISIGQQLIIPGGKPESLSRSVASKANDNRSTSQYFIIPTKGYNWGALHGHNGVDIANACDTTPIYAAAQGTVIKAQYGWNGGYGGEIVVNHPNGMSTVYGHLNKILVNAGQYVSQGAVIGYMGNSGKVTGPTGCHLHFEVRGGRNFMAK